MYFDSTYCSPTFYNEENVGCKLISAQRHPPRDKRGRNALSCISHSLRPSVSALVCYQIISRAQLCISDMRSTTTYPEAGRKLLLNRTNVRGLNVRHRSRRIRLSYATMFGNTSLRIIKSGLLFRRIGTLIYLRCTRNASQQRAAAPE